MFHIFTKKRFLVDALNGFVDIHNHILPGIDDGAKTVEESIAMIKEFGSIGVTNFIATPHIMSEYYPNTEESIQNAYLLLKNTCVEKGITHINLEAAAEHMVDVHFEAILASNQIMPIRGEYLLAEMSYLQPYLNFETAMIQSMKSGYFCILAHPERYTYLHHKKKKYNDYRAIGILYQLNLLSLGEYYGPKINKMALELLNRGMIDFVGTDVHHLKHLKALKELSISNNTYQKLLPIVRNTINTFY